MQYNRLFILLAALMTASSSVGDTLPRMVLDNNLKCVDLSDLDGDLPLEVVETHQILRQSEDWEHSTWKNPNWPDGGGASLGYPTVARNDHGPQPDGRYYLYYAHHDPRSGIGVAVADQIAGPYSKDVTVPGRSDNQVVPSFHADNPNPDDPSHNSSPWVVWNEAAQLWFMYFHYFNHAHTKTNYQTTALATTADLASHQWTVEHADGTMPPWRPVLPVTDAAWMNEASSYHAVQCLPDGRWLAFLRGTSTDGTPPSLGFGTSADGRTWKYFTENPVIHQNDGGDGRDGVYRPAFVGYLGTNAAGHPEYLLAWQESVRFDGDNRLIFGRTSDFKTVTRDPRGYSHWSPADGCISPWRIGGRLYLFSGMYVHVMELTVANGDP